MTYAEKIERNVYVNQEDLVSYYFRQLDWLSAWYTILAKNNEDKVYVNQGEAFTDLQILIKYKFLLNFLHELVYNEFFKLIYNMYM